MQARCSYKRHRLRSVPRLSPQPSRLCTPLNPVMAAAGSDGPGGASCREITSPLPRLQPTTVANHCQSFNPANCPAIKRRSGTTEGNLLMGCNETVLQRPWCSPPLTGSQPVFNPALLRRADPGLTGLGDHRPRQPTSVHQPPYPARSRHHSAANHQRHCSTRAVSKQIHMHNHTATSTAMHMNYSMKSSFTYVLQNLFFYLSLT